MIFSSIKTFIASVVTRDWKYIFWPYAAKGFEPTEELYQLSRDPLELKNLASAASGPLEEMRGHYDAAVSDWKRDSVPDHGYPPYGDHFDRSQRWVP